jgi:cis-3-alkyl-4-acyloxetan-2-one decarboxylase
MSEAWRAEYPFASQQILIDGHRYHYVDEGQGNQSVLCVHGNPTWSFYYRSLISGLRNDARVLAVDHLGCGLSDKPQRYDYCLEKHIDNLVEFIQRLDLRNVMMVVHDWGGAIGLGAAERVPDRIAKLLILNTGAFPPPFIPLRIAACRLPLVGTFAMRQLNLFAWTATFMAIDRLPRLSQTAKEGLLAPYDSWEHRVAIDRFVKDIPLTRRHRTWKVLEQIEQQLVLLQNKPTAFVWGMKDWCFRPECLVRLGKAFPKATICELPDVGHYVMEEAPDEVLQIAEMLLETPAHVPNA